MLFLNIICANPVAKGIPLYAGPKIFVKLVFFSLIICKNNSDIKLIDCPSVNTPLLKKNGLVLPDLSSNLPNFKASFSIQSFMKAFL